MTPNRRQTFLLLAVFLLVLALAAALWQTARGLRSPSAPPPPRRAAGAPPASHGPSDAAGAETAEVSGLGPLPYAKELKSMDFSDVFIRCGFARPRMRRHWEKGDPKPRADIYLNDKGEIVHIRFNKGKYETKSRAAEAIYNLEHKVPDNSGGMRIVRFGIPGLTLDNTEMLKPLLRRTIIDNIAGPYADSLELEITPVVVEVTAEGSNNPEHFGRRFPMFLQTYSFGGVAPGWTPRYGDYDPEDLVARCWTISTFLPGADAGAGYVYYEPFIEAWERREGGKAPPKPPRPEGRSHRR